jgi:L-serine dehydratase
LLGFAPDDQRLKEARTLAPKAGLHFEFGTVDLGEKVHPNSVRIHLQGDSYAVEMIGSSVGGGAVVVVQIDQYPTEVRGSLETLVLWHSDTSGFLAHVVSVCACVELNIAAVRTSRHQRGQEALTTLEVDGAFETDILSVLGRSHGMRRLAHLPAFSALQP